MHFEAGTGIKCQHELKLYNEEAYNPVPVLYVMYLKPQRGKKSVTLRTTLVLRRMVGSSRLLLTFTVMASCLLAVKSGPGKTPLTSSALLVKPSGEIFSAVRDHFWETMAPLTMAAAAR